METVLTTRTNTTFLALLMHRDAQGASDYDEDMRTFDQYGKMPPIPDMTEEKWNSLTELQKEEYISEYNTIRERDEELERLRNKMKSGANAVV